ncbi:hypothetical protein N7478_005728 [Penicillium angulare]|uniref:uncharacterized protein n=1 Tax=Penicillium angulare TaxID=116970 RepID=UPI0025417338|nr:uncharacterized protein N7478_005728 [Penicillium angulare]KAJ5280356.1 hypothetical protein N7478_005728 [Penicillium angulare]
MEPEGSENDEHQVPSSNLARRACDQCRARKARAKSHMSLEGESLSLVNSKSSESRWLMIWVNPKHSVGALTSKRSEHKIDFIEERLGGIEKALQELVAASRSHVHTPNGSFGPPYRSPIPNARVNSPAVKLDHAGLKGPGYTSNFAIEQHDLSSSFEGNSSLAAHSVYAREFLESAVSHSTPEVLSSPKINEALSSLRRIVELQNKRRETDPQRAHFPNQESKLGSRCDIRELKMPPQSVVLTVLREVKDNPPSTFGGFIPFFDVDYFIETCRQVYFCTDEYSDATFISANFGLYCLFIELTYVEKDPAIRDEYQHYVQMSKHNLEAAVASLNILMPVTNESIVALILGAMHGLEISKPSVGWTLASTALHMCQTLGYHRLSSMEHDTPAVRKQKQRIFWSLYTLLNLMALRLGRASPMEDYDIGLPPPSETFDDGTIWGKVCALWTTQATLQSKVYTLLYSPAALNQPESQRVSHARRLAAEMNTEIIEPFESIMSTRLDLNDMDIVYLQTDKVSRLAILTLIYRAIPAESGSSGTFIPECIETARASLQCHQGCVGSLQEASEVIRCSYMHWAVLLSPFVPFIVMFCHVIATSDEDDLTRLDDFVASLHPLCSFSQAVDRLHNICSVLATVARLYVETKTRSKAEKDQNLASVGQEFDVYLSALGLAPGNTMTSSGYFQPDVPGMQVEAPESTAHMQDLSMLAVRSQRSNHEAPSITEISQAAQLGNWFSGNQYMMGLLEEDLFQFNPNG